MERRLANTAPVTHHNQAALCRRSPVARLARTFKDIFRRFRLGDLSRSRWKGPNGPGNRGRLQRTHRSVRALVSRFEP